VIRSGANAFNPNSINGVTKRYTLDPANLRNGDVVVVGGANFINNFQLIDADFVLAVRGDDIVANRIFCTVSFDLDGAVGEQIPSAIRISANGRLSEAQMPSSAGFARFGFVNDGKWYIRSNSEYREFVFGENGTPVIGNITLYLRWTNEPHTTPDTTPGSRFSAGPNPVSRQTGVVNFFWEGEEIKNGTLSIYNASGNRIRKINVNNDKGGADFSRRVICSWNLMDQSSRPVPAGNYLVIGTITTRSNKKEEVSVMMSVQ
jgi:hypothetical protein